MVWSRLSLTVQLVLSTLVIGLLAIVITSYRSSRKNQLSLETQLLASLSLVAEAELQYVENYLAKGEERVIDFSSDGFIREKTEAVLAGDLTAQAALNEHLSLNKQSLDPSIYGITITDLSGTVIASTDDQEIGENEAAHDYFLKAKELTYGQAYTGSVAQTHNFDANLPSLTHSALLTTTGLVSMDDQRRSLGVIINYLSLESLQTALAGQEKSKVITSLNNSSGWRNFEIFLVDNQTGFMLTPSHYVADAVMRQKVESLAIKRCASGQKTSARYTSYWGKPVLGVSRCLTSMAGWTLVVELDEQEVLEDLLAMRQELIVQRLLALAVIVVCIFVLAQLSLRPLNQLAKAARGFSQGNWDQELKIHGASEISQVVLAFNEMAQALKSLYQELEDKVHQRTAQLKQKVDELERLNRLMVGREVKMIELKRKLKKYKAQEKTQDVP